MSIGPISNTDARDMMIFEEFKKLDASIGSVFNERIWPGVVKTLEAKLDGKTWLQPDDLRKLQEEKISGLPKKDRLVFTMFHYLRANAKAYHSDGLSSFRTVEEIVNHYHSDLSLLKTQLESFFKDANLKGQMPFAKEASNRDRMNLEHGGDNRYSLEKRNAIWERLSHKTSDKSVKKLIKKMLASTNNMERRAIYADILANFKLSKGQRADIPYLQKDSITHGNKPIGGRSAHKKFEKMMDTMDRILLSLSQDELNRVLLSPDFMYDLKKNEIAILFRTSDREYGIGHNKFSDPHGPESTMLVDKNNKRINRASLYTFFGSIFVDKGTGFIPVDIDRVPFRGNVGRTKAKFDLNYIRNTNPMTVIDDLLHGLSAYVLKISDSKRGGHLANLNSIRGAGYGSNNIMYAMAGDHLSVLSDINNLDEVLFRKSMLNKAAGTRMVYNAAEINKILLSTSAAVRKSNGKLGQILKTMHNFDDIQVLKITMAGSIIFEDFSKKVNAILKEGDLITDKRLQWVELELTDFIKEKLKDKKILNAFISTFFENNKKQVEGTMRYNMKTGKVQIEKSVLLDTRRATESATGNGSRRLLNLFGSIFKVTKVTNAEVKNIKIKFPNGLPINLFYRHVMDSLTDQMVWRLDPNPKGSIGRIIQIQKFIQGGVAVTGSTRLTKGEVKQTRVIKMVDGKTITHLFFWEIFSLGRSGTVVDDFVPKDSIARILKFGRDKIFHPATGTKAGIGVHIGDSDRQKVPVYSEESRIAHNKILNSPNVPNIYSTDFIELYRTYFAVGHGQALWGAGGIDKIFVLNGPSFPGTNGMSLWQYALVTFTGKDLKALEEFTVNMTRDVKAGILGRRGEIAAKGNELWKILITGDPGMEERVARYLNNISTNIESLTKATHTVPGGVPIRDYMQKMYDARSTLFNIVGQKAVGELVTAYDRVHQKLAISILNIKEHTKFIKLISRHASDMSRYEKYRKPTIDIKTGDVILVTDNYANQRADREALALDPKATKTVGTPKSYMNLFFTYVEKHPDVFKTWLNDGDWEKINWQWAQDPYLKKIRKIYKENFNRLNDFLPDDLKFDKSLLDKHGKFTTDKINSKFGANLSRIAKFLEVGLNRNGLERQNKNLNKGQMAFDPDGERIVEFNWEGKKYIINIDKLDEMFVRSVGAFGSFKASKSSYGAKFGQFIKSTGVKVTPLMAFVGPVIAGASSGDIEDTLNKAYMDDFLDFYVKDNGTLDIAKLKNEGLRLNSRQQTMRDRLIPHSKNTRGTFLEWAANPTDPKKLKAYIDNWLENAFGVGAEHWGVYGDPIRTQEFGPIMEQLNQWLLKFNGWDIREVEAAAAITALVAIFLFAIAAIFYAIGPPAALILLIIIIVAVAIDYLDDGQVDDMLTLLGMLTYLDAGWQWLSHLRSSLKPVVTVDLIWDYGAIYEPLIIPTDLKLQEGKPTLDQIRVILNRHIQGMRKRGKDINMNEIKSTIKFYGYDPKDVMPWLIDIKY